MFACFSEIVPTLPAGATITITGAVHLAQQNNSHDASDVRLMSRVAKREPEAQRELA